MATSTNWESLSDRGATRLPEIVFTLDLAGYFKFVNAEGQRLTGYSCEEVLQMNVVEIVAPELAAEVRSQLARALKQRMGAVYQVEVITKDRQRVTLETSIQVVMRHGRPFEIRGIAVPPISSLSNSSRRCLDADFILGAPIAEW